MNVQVFAFNPFIENTYVLYDESKECIIVDPGCYDPREKEQLSAFISDQRLTVKLLVNTHCHIDHVLGNQYVIDTYGVDFLIHEVEKATLDTVKIYAPNYGFQHYQEALPSGYLKEGEMVTFGNTTLEVIFVPGHAPGHIAFYHKESKQIIAGDVLFKNSIGRTDLPGGDMDTLLRSIQQKLFTLPHDVVVMPGHGEHTTIGFEKENNPFCGLNAR